MAFSINDFRSQLEYDGTRPNLFQVYLTFPLQVVNAGLASQKITFMCKAASLPGKTRGIVPAFYFGREIKVPGNLSLDDWTITVYNDEDFSVRNAFESWDSLISQHTGNVRDPSMLNNAGYGATGYALQWGKTGNQIKRYDFDGFWPTALAPIDLDWGNNNTIEEFTVTMAVTNWTSTLIAPATTDTPNS